MRPQPSAPADTDWQPDARFALRINEVVAVLQDFYAPRAMFLFGSVARGLHNGRSDLDILVIAESRARRPDRTALFRDYWAGRRPHVDVTFLTPQEVVDQRANAHSFLSSIAFSARHLHGDAMALEHAAPKKS